MNYFNNKYELNWIELSENIPKYNIIATLQKSNIRNDNFGDSWHKRHQYVGEKQDGCQTQISYYFIYPKS
jgi:hypothetical protein